ncbi:MAG: type ISP restriction/modification enzyme, partial [Thermoguttaceae bacterium]
MPQKIQDKKLATIHYYDIGDYLTREEKLQILRDAKSIAGIPWKTITPNDKNDWINQQDDTFDTFIPLGDKSDKTQETIFATYSLGVATNRDSWCYNFSQKKLSSNMKRMIAFYNEQVESYQEHKKYNGDKSVDDFVDNDRTKIAWTRALKRFLSLGTTIQFQKKSIMPSVYRPFQKQYLYFNPSLNEAPGRNSQIFPEPGMENLLISVCGIGGSKDFSPFIHNTIVDLNLQEAGAQCFP